MESRQHDLLEQVIDEIEALHVFFVDWFGGQVDDTDAVFANGLEHRLAADFTIVPPAGLLLQRTDLVESIRAGYANNPAFEIAIRNVALVHAGGDVVVATYEEWQRNAKASTPPDNGRTATVVFRRTRGGPGLRWQHVHETWMPRDVMARNLPDVFATSA